MSKLIVAVVVALALGLAGLVGSSPGPAPNSGDGIPDGSGFPTIPAPGPQGK